MNMSERESAILQAREVLTTPAPTGAACTAARRALWPWNETDEGRDLMRQLARRRHEADARVRQQRKLRRMFKHRPSGGEAA